MPAAARIVRDDEHHQRSPDAGFGIDRGTRYIGRRVAITVVCEAAVGAQRNAKAREPAIEPYGVDADDQRQERRPCCIEFSEP